MGWFEQLGTADKVNADNEQASEGDDGETRMDVRQK